MKRVGAAVCRNIPPLGHAANRVGAAGSFRDETFKERVDDLVLRHARDDLRVKILRLGAVAEIQNGARAGRRGGRRGGAGLGFSFAATGDQQSRRDQGRAEGK